MTLHYLYLENAPKIIEHFYHQLKGIRTGRVNASVLETVLVDAYGTKMHIMELATIQQPEATQLLITPFDKGVLNPIEKAIRDANIGVNPVNDGAGIRLVFPPMTEENRKIRAKEVDKHLEEVKIQVRQSRLDALDVIKKQEKEGDIGEDDLKRGEEELQKEVVLLNTELETIAKAKKDELLKL
jgi:ribosome recycling factor